MNINTNLNLGRIYGYHSPKEGNNIINSGFTIIEQVLSTTGSTTISSSGNTSGILGDFVWDDNYLYAKTNSGWGRIALDYNF